MSAFFLGFLALISMAFATPTATTAKAATGCCCGATCACEDCAYVALGCECDSGGPCACDADCCHSGGCCADK